MVNGPEIKLTPKATDESSDTNLTSEKVKSHRRWVKPILHGVGYLTLLVLGYGMRYLTTNRGA